MTTDDKPDQEPPDEPVTLRSVGVWLAAAVFLAVLDALPWVLVLLVGWAVWWAVSKLWGLVFG